MIKIDHVKWSRKIRFWIAFNNCAYIYIELSFVIDLHSLKGSLLDWFCMCKYNITHILLLLLLLADVELITNDKF